ncbi:hypothetical protein BGZ82_003812 [Podila clonocystis]|nr:hypothetical protein BGZ82_003812 [Podila clonocystis]
MALHLIDVMSVYMGPVLLSLAFVLLSLTIGCYFSVFIPFHYLSEEEESDTSWSIGYITQMIWALYVVWGILANYYFAIITPPGSVLGKVSLGDHAPWPYWLDKSLVAFSMVVATVIGMAVGGMGGWHWYLTLTAQTTLEQYNNNFMKSVCDKKGDTFHNMYDFGAVRNLQDFFNIGPRGPWYTALFPLRIPPVGNGKKFEKSGRGFVLACHDDDDIV